MTCYHLLRSTSILRRGVSSRRLPPSFLASSWPASSNTEAATTTASNSPSLLWNVNQNTDGIRRPFSSSVTTSSSDNTNNSKPLLERTDKNWFQRMIEKYSIKQQTNRILVAELLLQAAISQASDP